MVTDYSKLMLCPDCCEKRGQLWRPWITDNEKNNNKICEYCGKPFIETNLIYKEVRIISHTSTEWSFYKAMMDLKEKDIIEFNLKLSQLPKPKTYVPNGNSTVTQTATVKQSTPESQPEPPKPTCPKCGCENIQVVRKRWSFWRGFATNATERVCANCNHRW